MNIAELKKLIADLPDTMEVMAEVHVMPEDDVFHHPIDDGEVDELDDGTFFFLMTSIDADDEQEEETVPEH